MSIIPVYQYPCIAPDTASSNSVYVFGVPSTAEGRLEAYRVDLSNINAPHAVFFSNYTEFTWQSAAPKLCSSFPGDSTNSPIMVQQFGTKSFSTQMHPNGAFESWVTFPGIFFVSPKLYSFTGANGNFNWYTAMTNATHQTTASPWTSVRWNDTHLLSSYRNPNLVGYHCVFESDGKSGTIFTTSSSASLVDNIQLLSNPQPIDMGGIVLTQDAYSVTQGSVGYVIDRAALDGSTRIYKISPGSGSFKLIPVTPAKVPPFWPNRAVTSIGSQLIFFGGLQNGAPTTVFHIYDSLTNQWAGPNLASYRKSNTGAIIGGVVGGLVLLALIGFFLFRHNKNKRKVTNAMAPTTNTTGMIEYQAQYVDGNKVPPNHMVHPPYNSVPSTQPVYPPPAQYLGINTATSPPLNTYSQYGMTAIPLPYKPGYAERPVIFKPQSYQTQSSHSYQPPVLTNIDQSSPNTFQPSVAASPTAGSSASTTTAYSPASYNTSTTPHSHAVHVPTSSAGNPQYIQPPDGYAS